MNVRKRRRVVALAMLMGMGIATFEPVAGEVRDALEHYGVVLAVGHAADSAVPGASDAGQSHDGQHIKGFDHCTHTHGSSVRTSSVRPSAELIIPEPEPPVTALRHPEVPPARLYHPPKA
jgi:hypothetical protein